MNVALNDVLHADNIDEFKNLGKYLELKSTIEENIDLKLGVNGWDSLFKRIKNLKTSLADNQSLLLLIYSQSTFREAKSKLTQLLGFKVKAKSRNQLKNKIDNLIKYFCQTVFDPYKRFEETKMKNFKNSSKLEGIEIETTNNFNSLESILAKHRK